MTTNHYDVLIIGGGFAGTAIAYQLARRGAEVLLLEARTIGSGTSGACAGRAQIAESHPGPDLDLVLAGLARLETLEAELGHGFEWRRLGNLMLIERNDHWRWWAAQVAYLRERGIPAEMLDRGQLQEAEPLLDAARFMGAAWCLEGHLNPLKYGHAFAQAARRDGATLLQHTPVVDLELVGGQVTAVHTPTSHYRADTILVTAGAWTGQVLQKANLTLPVQFTHAEAMISEPLPPRLNNHIGLADFYETIHNAARAVSVGVAQQQNGTLLVTEAVEMTRRLHRRNLVWGMPEMARELLALFPALAGTRVVRTWAAPSPFLPDEQPAIGRLPELDNLFVATCFHLTITTIPVVSELVARMILGETVPALDRFSPVRFVAQGA